MHVYNGVVPQVGKSREETRSKEDELQSLKDRLAAAEDAAKVGFGCIAHTSPHDHAMS